MHSVPRRAIPLVHEPDILSVGFTAGDDSYTISDAGLKDAALKSLELPFGLVMDKVLEILGIHYTVPSWFPVRSVVRDILDLWDGSVEALPLQYDIDISNGVSFTSVQQIMNAQFRILVDVYGVNSINKDWIQEPVGYWTILPNIIISNPTQRTVIESLPDVKAAIIAAKEAEKSVWQSEINDLGATELVKRIQSARDNTVDILRRLRDQSLESYNIAYNEAQTALRRYIARRKEHKDVSSVPLSAEHIKEHVNGMRSVYGVSGVLVGKDALYIKFNGFSVDYPACGSHNMGDKARTSTQTVTCEVSGRYCEGERINLCEGGHQMSLGSICSCGKPYRGIGFKCISCGKTYMSFGPNSSRLSVECKYCGDKRPVFTYDFQPYMGTIKINRADDSSVKLTATRRPPDIEANHPHVSYDGKCCWGSAYGVPAYYLREGMYKEIISMTVALLRSYVPNDAYTRIGPWKRP